MKNQISSFSPFKAQAFTCKARLPVALTPLEFRKHWHSFRTVKGWRGRIIKFEFACVDNFHRSISVKCESYNTTSKCVPYSRIDSAYHQIYGSCLDELFHAFEVSCEFCDTTEAIELYDLCTSSSNHIKAAARSVAAVIKVSKGIAMPAEALEHINDSYSGLSSSKTFWDYMILSLEAVLEGDLHVCTGEDANRKPSLTFNTSQSQVQYHIARNMILELLQSGGALWKLYASSAGIVPWADRLSLLESAKAAEASAIEVLDSLLHNLSKSPSLLPSDDPTSLELIGTPYPMTVAGASYILRIWSSVDFRHTAFQSGLAGKAISTASTWASIYTARASLARRSGFKNVDAMCHLDSGAGSCEAAAAFLVELLEAIKPLAEKQVAELERRHPKGEGLWDYSAWHQAVFPPPDLDTLRDLKDYTMPRTLLNGMSHVLSQLLDIHWTALSHTQLMKVFKSPLLTQFVEAQGEQAVGYLVENREGETLGVVLLHEGGGYGARYVPPFGLWRKEGSSEGVVSEGEALEGMLHQGIESGARLMPASRLSAYCIDGQDTVRECQYALEDLSQLGAMDLPVVIIGTSMPHPPLPHDPQQTVLEVCHEVGHALHFLMTASRRSHAMTSSSQADYSTATTSESLQSVAASSQGDQPIAAASQACHLTAASSHTDHTTAATSQVQHPTAATSQAYKSTAATSQVHRSTAATNQAHHQTAASSQVQQSTATASQAQYSITATNRAHHSHALYLPLELIETPSALFEQLLAMDPASLAAMARHRESGQQLPAETANWLAASIRARFHSPLVLAQQAIVMLLDQLLMSGACQPSGPSILGLWQRLLDTFLPGCPLMTAEQAWAVSRVVSSRGQGYAYASSWCLAHGILDTCKVDDELDVSRLKPVLSRLLRTGAEVSAMQWMDGIVAMDGGDLQATGQRLYMPCGGDNFVARVTSGQTGSWLS